ncbi:hypothetical protein MRX96_046453 [Rhipicephalus microplus]
MRQPPSNRRPQPSCQARCDVHWQATAPKSSHAANQSTYYASRCGPGPGFRGPLRTPCWPIVSKAPPPPPLRRTGTPTAGNHDGKPVPKKGPSAWSRRVPVVVATARPTRCAGGVVSSCSENAPIHEPLRKHDEILGQLMSG